MSNLLGTVRGLVFRGRRRRLATLTRSASEFRASDRCYSPARRIDVAFDAETAENRNVRRLPCPFLAFAPTDIALPFMRASLAASQPAKNAVSVCKYRKRMTVACRIRESCGFLAISSPQNQHPIRNHNALRPCPSATALAAVAQYLSCCESVPSATSTYRRSPTGWPPGNGAAAALTGPCGCGVPRDGSGP